MAQPKKSAVNIVTALKYSFLIKLKSIIKRIIKFTKKPISNHQRIESIEKRPISAFDIEIRF